MRLSDFIATFFPFQVQVFMMKVGHLNQEMVVRNKVFQQQNVYVDKTIPQV